MDTAKTDEDPKEKQELELFKKAVREALQEEEREERLRKGWMEEADKVVAQVISDNLKKPHSTLEESKRLVSAILSDPRLDSVFPPAPEVMEALQRQNPNLAQAMPSSKRQDLGELVAKEPSVLARSVDAASTNPKRVGLIERSGIIDFIALAVQGTNFVSANDTAVTINLNAAGLLKRRAPGVSDVRAYQDRGLLNQLQGSVTFGSKIPQGQIAGLTGLPDADRLFDVLVWDVKVRFGDRDPRAKQWDDRVRGGKLFIDTFVLPSVLIQIPREELNNPDNHPLVQALRMQQEVTANAVKDEIARSWQVSLKFAGQHLTQEVGMNKYSASLLADKGLGGPANLTLNATYSILQNLPKGANLPVDIKTFAVAGGLSGTIMKDVLVSGIGTEVTLSAEGTFPHNGGGAPERKRVFKADLELQFPVSDTLRVPVSVTWSNDPNNLTKQRYAKGQIGINYDFGSIKKLLKGGA